MGLLYFIYDSVSNSSTEIRFTTIIATMSLKYIYDVRTDSPLMFKTYEWNHYTTSELWRLLAVHAGFIQFDHQGPASYGESESLRLKSKPLTVEVERWYFIPVDATQFLLTPSLEMAEFIVKWSPRRLGKELSMVLTDHIAFRGMTHEGQWTDIQGPDPRALSEHVVECLYGHLRQFEYPSGLSCDI